MSGLWLRTVQYSEEGTEIPYDSFVGLKSLPMLSGRGVSYVTARMLPPPSPFLTYFASLSGSSLMLTSLFLSIVTFICKTPQNVRSQGNVKT